MVYAEGNGPCAQWCMQEETTLDIPRLKLFVQVAELGSLTKAARLNGSVQSSISRHIRALEREYGGHLFYRTGHGVVLSELGERIFVRVKSWLTETEQLENELKAAAGVAGRTSAKQPWPS